nr:hypothetical protein [Burkholderia ambifaria]
MPHSYGKSLKRYSAKERVAKTALAIRTVRSAIKKPGSGSILSKTRVLKAHDPKRKIAKLEDYMKAGMKKTFPVVYRGIWDAQDEIVRTSLITDLLVGLEKAGLSKGEMARLKTAIDGFSSIRLPTRWSGFKLKGGDTVLGFSEMQHPTSAGKGIWIPSKSSFSKAHTALDEARVKAALDAINTFVVKDKNGAVTLASGVAIEDIVKAALIAAGTFTLNYFTAPALASNVDATASGKVKKAQTQAREFMKDQLESIGAKRATGSTSIVIPKLNLPTREWKPDALNPGEVSPRRGSPISLSVAELSWAVE